MADRDPKDTDRTTPMAQVSGPQAPPPAEGARPVIGDIADARTIEAPLVEGSDSLIAAEAAIAALTADEDRTHEVAPHRKDEAGFAMTSESLGAPTENDLDAEDVLLAGKAFGPGSLAAHRADAPTPAPAPQRSSDTQPMMLPNSAPGVPPAVTATLLPDGDVMADVTRDDAPSDDPSPPDLFATPPDPSAAPPAVRARSGTVIIALGLGVVALALFAAAWLLR